MGSLPGTAGRRKLVGKTADPDRLLASHAEEHFRFSSKAAAVRSPGSVLLSRETSSARPAAGARQSAPGAPAPADGADAVARSHRRAHVERTPAALVSGAGAVCYPSIHRLRDLCSSSRERTRTGWAAATGAIASKMFRKFTTSAPWTGRGARSPLVFRAGARRTQGPHRCGARRLRSHRAPRPRCGRGWRPRRRGIVGSQSATAPARPIVRAMLRVSATACSRPTSTSPRSRVSWMRRAALPRPAVPTVAAAVNVAGLAGRELPAAANALSHPQPPPLCF